MSNLKHGFPVKLTAIKIGEGEITLTLQTLDLSDTARMLESLKQRQATD